MVTTTIRKPQDIIVFQYQEMREGNHGREYTRTSGTTLSLQGGECELANPTRGKITFWAFEAEEIEELLAKMREVREARKRGESIAQTE